MTGEHEEAMSAAAVAERLALEGREEAAREQLERAAELEVRAADAVPADRPRTRAILRVSAVSLWLQAGHPARAAELAQRYLAETTAPEVARELDELRVECLRAERAALALPAGPADVAIRARERELALARGEIASGAVIGLRAA